ncbi:MAG TPA: SURF1 family protein [Methyloceanibacter sp.]|jgi:surfeit locus 1 family protein|nr:SURF1 family protein [Methyloceanibacter sp.]
MPAKKLIGFTIVTLAALALLIGLGVWQLQRLDWKRSLIAEIETRTKARPIALTEAIAFAKDGHDPSYLHVRVAGRFENDKERHLYAIADGAPGWHLITPLVTEDGAIVLIDRGFVPDAMKEQPTRPQSLVEGETSVTGLIRVPESQGAFTPNTDLERNRWYFRDLDRMARSMFGDKPPSLAPFFLEAEESGPPGSWPRGGQTRLGLPNNHLQYALTWFLLALCLLVIYAVYLRQALQAPKP